MKILFIIMIVGFILTGCELITYEGPQKEKLTYFATGKDKNARLDMLLEKVDSIIKKTTGE